MFILIIVITDAKLCLVAELKDVLNFGSMTRNQFNFHYVVGKGGFGKVIIFERIIIIKYLF